MERKGERENWIGEGRWDTEKKVEIWGEGAQVNWKMVVGRIEGGGEGKIKK